MYPHERSLVKRLEKKPFALVAIEADPDRDAARLALKKEGNDWPHVWDGRDQQRRIHQAWNIEWNPHIYVLDAKGVIRFKDVGIQELDGLVDRLIAETESSGQN